MTEYVELGQTGRLVSRIGFGGAVVGLENYISSYNPAAKSNIAQVVEAMETAIQLGINYFDTAPGYGNGLSEKIFGQGLKHVDPKDIFLATKTSYGSRDDVLYSVEQSLKNLQRDTIDLVQIHSDHISREKEEMILKPHGMLETLEELQKAGTIRHIGFTTEDNNDAVYRLIRTRRFDMLQLCYNFLFQHPYEPSRPFGSILEAEEHSMGIVTMRAPTSGTFQRWIQMVNPSNQFNYTPALIQFVLSNPLVDVALVGMRTAQRVRENVAICNDLDGRVNIAAVHQRYTEK